MELAHKAVSPRRVAIIAVVAVLLILLVAFCLVRLRVVPINQLFISSNDVWGVDVSEFQGEIDMGRLAEQGVSFAYVKATEGSGYVDERFHENWASAKAVGLPVGAYHFFSFDSPGATQAANFIETVGSLDGALIPAIDVEWYGDYREHHPDRDAVARELSSFIAIIEAEYGVRPIIYSGRDVYDELIARDFSDYPQWASSTIFPPQVDGWEDWDVWQYSNRTSLEGYNGKEPCIDLNVLGPGRTLESLMVGGQ